MFVVTYRKSSNSAAQAEYFDDIKTLGDTIIGITGSEDEANSAMKWCGNAQWGSKVVRQKLNYKIECFNETQLKEDVEKVVKEICKQLNIEYSFVGLDNDALTWDIDIDLSWIKFHHQYGYYCVINHVLPDGTCKELFSTTSRDKKQFINDVVTFAKKIGKRKENTDKLNLSDTRPQGNSYCSFIVGQKYIGKQLKHNEIKSIIITHKTPKFVFFETDWGYKGKAMIKYSNGHEAILIRKSDDLLVISTDKWS